jgi:hypothetical protein
VKAVEFIAEMGAKSENLLSRTYPGRSKIWRSRIILGRANDIIVEDEREQGG